ncbi:MAG: hypothetical protein WEF28_08800 [Acidimicrobiia bacterium]
MSKSMLWQPLSGSFGMTRDHLHQIAYFALSPARHGVDGKMGLRATPGGFGTPEFEGRVARVDGSLLVHEEGGNVATRQISTVRAAAEFFGDSYAEVWFEDFKDPLTPIGPDVALSVDADDSHLIGFWFDFGFEVLDSFRGSGRDADDPSATQIWPEHFDAAMETGDSESGKRASYGFSPGDEKHAEPYVYVAAWGEIDRSNAYWNDEAFNGSSLSYAELAASPEPFEAALGFLRDGYRILNGEG